MSPDSLVIINEIADRVASTNGAALIADYGEMSNENRLSLRVRAKDIRSKFCCPNY